MPRALLRRWILVALVLAIPILGVRGLSTAAQDESSGPLIQVDLDTSRYPVAPAFVRLLRITLEPGASSPLHTHPGPEIALVERGTLTVKVTGPARLIVPSDAAEIGGTPVSDTLAPVDSEFELTRGDQLVYYPQTPMTFRNAGSEIVSILTVVLLPAGHQHPPGVTYLEGQPSADAFTGVTPTILGDGIASSMPSSGIRIVVDQLQIGQGQPIPASAQQTMLSLLNGTLDFTVIGGKVQISRGATPGPQSDSAPGSETSLVAGDALFFPLGMKEAARAEDDPPISFLRLTISPATGDQPTPSGDGQGAIQITGTDISTPPAEGTPSAGDGTPTAEASPTPTPPAGPREGDTATVNSEGVNVRACPSVTCDVVTQLFFGQTVTIQGAPEDDGDYIWWPISVDDDPSITGYIAQDFLDLPESGE